MDASRNVALAAVMCYLATPARTAPKPVTEAWIAQIRRQYDTINRNEARYRKEEGPEDESGDSSLSGYLEGGHLRKLFCGGYVSLNGEEQELYFWKDQLIFLFDQKITYRNHHRVVKATQRCYFHDGHMIRWLGPGNAPVAPGSVRFTKQEKPILRAVTYWLRESKALHNVSGWGDYVVRFH